MALVLTRYAPPTKPFVEIFERISSYWTLNCTSVSSKGGRTVSLRSNLNRNKPAAVSASVIPPQDWGAFLETFGHSHPAWLTRIETEDTVTEERVISSEMSFESIELDLEDQRNPRINVTGKFDNKTVKHILFLPSRLVFRSATSEGEESLEIETLNTKTTVHVRPRG